MDRRRSEASLGRACETGAWVLLCLAASFESLLAQGAPPPELRVIREVVSANLDDPVELVHAGDGTGRLFVLERDGRIRPFDAVGSPGPVFLDISDRVRSTSPEQGLLGLAFHPRFGSNGFFFVNYIDAAGNTRISRFYAPSPTAADPDSEALVLELVQPAANHNGGRLAFGPDGYLYVGAGDGGGGGDPFGNAQNGQTLLGTILRLDVDAGPPYGIPADNPFVGVPAVRDEIWALGLRNPWKYSFDRSTGDLFIADVGQNAYEEVNLQLGSSSGGENYGWPLTEGTHCFPLGTNCSTAGLTLPIHEYDHGQGCSVTGGYVYRGAIFSFVNGVYFFGDFCSGRIWGSFPGAGARATALLARLNERITSFGEDQSGELYLVGRNPASGMGEVHRLRFGLGRPDGDDSAEPAVWQPATGAWSTLTSRGGVVRDILGEPGDIPVAADYDGDGVRDVAVYRPGSPSTWLIVQSASSLMRTVAWGGPTAVAVPGDYDGDGVTDIAVYREGAPSIWSILQSSNGAIRSVSWGRGGAVPVPADYDGDGKVDVAVYVPSVPSIWNILRSTTSRKRSVAWGTMTGLPIAGDYDGDGSADVAIYQPGSGRWSVLRSVDGAAQSVSLGGGTAIPVPADYDGDGRVDHAVYEPGSPSTWDILQSSTSTTRSVSWGSGSAVPLTSMPWLIP